MGLYNKVCKRGNVITPMIHYTYSYVYYNNIKWARFISNVLLTSQRLSLRHDFQGSYTPCHACNDAAFDFYCIDNPWIVVEYLPDGDLKTFLQVTQV